MKEHKVNILLIDPVGIKAGMDYYNDQLALALRARGYPTFIASNYISGISQEKFFSAEANSPWKKLINLLRGFFKAFRYAKKIKAEYVINHCFSSEWKDLIPYVFSLIFDIKVITIAHDVAGFALNDSVYIREKIYKQYSAFIIVHNEFSKKALLTYLKQEVVKNIYVIPHGHFLRLAEKNNNDRKTARKQLNIPADEKMILFFGQIKKQKGLDLLIHALSKTDENIHLTIAGKPWKDNFEHYHDRIVCLGLKDRVREMIRYISDEERDLLFHAADVIAIPYREIYQSGVLIMAMSYKLSIIASDLPANKEIIFPGYNGWLFKAGDSIDLAVQIEAFFTQNQEEEKQVADNGVQFLKENCSWEQIALKYDEMLS